MVELIPKKHEVRLPRVLEALFYISIGAFVFVIVSLGLFSLLIKRAEGNLEETKAAIQRERTPDRLQLEASVKAYAKKIEDFSKLLESHYDSRKLFAAVEGSTHPRVWFSDVSIDFEKFTVELSGFAESFYAVGQQIAILEQQQFFKNINLSDLSLSREGEVQFALDFSFDPKLFQY